MDHTLTSYRDFFSLSCKVLFSKDILLFFDVSVFGVLRRNDARMACTFALVDKANSNFRRIKLHYKNAHAKKFYVSKFVIIFYSMIDIKGDVIAIGPYFTRKFEGVGCLSSSI